MSKSPSLVVVAAFAGVLISAGAAMATEPTVSQPCRILAPRYEPKARPAQSEAVRWLGGARLHRPVATPCTPSRRPVDA